MSIPEPVQEAIDAAGQAVLDIVPSVESDYGRAYSGEVAAGIDDVWQAIYGVALSVAEACPCDVYGNDPAHCCLTLHQDDLCSRCQLLASLGERR